MSFRSGDNDLEEMGEFDGDMRVEANSPVVSVFIVPALTICLGEVAFCCCRLTDVRKLFGMHRQDESCPVTAASWLK